MLSVMSAASIAAEVEGLGGGGGGVACQCSDHTPDTTSYMAVVPEGSLFSR